jgi:hypothetical protein
MASYDLPSAIRSVIAIQVEPALFQPVEALGIRVILSDFGFESADAGHQGMEGSPVAKVGEFGLAQGGWGILGHRRGR